MKAQIIIQCYRGSLSGKSWNLLGCKVQAHCKTSKSFIKPTYQGQICGGRSHTVKGIKIPGGTETGCGGTEKGREWFSWQGEGKRGWERCLWWLPFASEPVIPMMRSLDVGRWGRESTAGGKCLEIWMHMAKFGGRQQVGYGESQWVIKGTLKDNHSNRNPSSPFLWAAFSTVGCALVISCNPINHNPSNRCHYHL